MTSKDAYREFSATKKDLPVFMQPFWLDLTCDPGKWEAIFSRSEDGSIRGAWAFQITERFGMRQMRLPVLTPFTALWIDTPDNLTVQKQMAHRHEVFSDLERQLPKVRVLELKLPWTMEDWLPLYWRGYRQETRYTFRFPQIDTERIYHDTSKSFRRNLREAERHYTVEVGNVHDMYRLMQDVFEIRETAITCTENKLEQIVQALEKRGQCHIYAARDEKGIQAAIFIVWDQHTTYYLIGGRSRAENHDGTALLLWNAIQDAAKRGHAFDFEGSMLEGVNKFFQHFGAQLTPYHYIYRYRGLAKLKYLK